jgi:hypothetical protein
MLVLESKGGLFEGMSASSRTCELPTRKEMGTQLQLQKTNSATELEMEEDPELHIKFCHPTLQF